MVLRPGLASFLEYLFEEFCVMIWSSAQPQNVEPMVNRILSPSQRQQLIAQWARDTLGLSESNYNKKVQVYKNLETVWKDASIQEKSRYEISMLRKRKIDQQTLFSTLPNSALTPATKSWRAWAMISPMRVPGSARSAIERHRSLSDAWAHGFSDTLADSSGRMFWRRFLAH